MALDFLFESRFQESCLIEINADLAVFAHRFLCPECPPTPLLFISLRLAPPSSLPSLHLRKTLSVAELGLLHALSTLASPDITSPSLTLAGLL